MYYFLKLMFFFFVFKFGWIDVFEFCFFWVFCFEGFEGWSLFDLVKRFSIFVSEIILDNFLEICVLGKLVEGIEGNDCFGSGDWGVEGVCEEIRIVGCGLGFDDDLILVIDVGGGVVVVVIFSWIGWSNGVVGVLGEGEVVLIIYIWWDFVVMSLVIVCVSVE